MQALGLFARPAILGRTNKSTVVLEKIVKENSLNRTGAVNFNNYGKQDSVGFSPCSDKFMDNFLLYVYVHNYFVTAKKTYTEVGHVNKLVSDLEQPKADELDKVYVRLKMKETDETVYYVQEFKIFSEARITPMFSSSYGPTSTGSETSS
ncbi:Hypothetical predicted protein [Paramuricea clavata]|uniref:Uncharacterized protein n=1 Tax=Paramuricea clavata TaxID=317549 RepID=A0A7D9KBJ4_PARCT|nr:Hypothetical predicted protein [Paramuricea clavata]